ncbi:uncharacterized protein N0V89_011931 [Didymosphaeria variabile]|uniref:Uncharacterized protein n=1 Tax=Didymosphaeria variabile TaxID=1932322 RepID=A0A9W9C569_9PLEO|nr:uncharacterized protein N0V89_011931 [Didymosphaeria variabile]KAJ4345796.1 hypothetical protein N0V89_011931 [Didymosphaeria variabile]
MAHPPAEVDEGGTYDEDRASLIVTLKVRTVVKESNGLLDPTPRGYCKAITQRNHEKSPLLKLPPELRNRIYAYVFCSTDVRSVYAEARLIPFVAGRFDLYYRDFWPYRLPGVPLPVPTTNQLLSVQLERITVIQIPFRNAQPADLIKDLKPFAGLERCILEFPSHFSDSIKSLVEDLQQRVGESVEVVVEGGDARLQYLEKVVHDDSEWWM